MWSALYRICEETDTMGIELSVGLIYNAIIHILIRR